LKSEARIEQQILDYLAKNPAAQDTLTGIVEWWLLNQTIVQATAEVETAVKNLLTAKKLKAQPGSDGQVYYSQFQKDENHGC
jgi:hypothetical protein